MSADDVANFLLSTDNNITRALGKLEFSMDSFRVDYEGYREIGHLIRSGGVTVAGASSAAGSPTGAVYTAAADRISLRPNMDLTGTNGRAVGDQADVVHECTHALMDFHRYQTTSAVQEATAYIAGAVYKMTRGYSHSRVQNATTRALLDAAFNVVYRRSMTQRPGQRLSTGDADVMVLMNTVAAHRAYPTADQPVTVDGISGGLLNPWYMPRHRLAPDGE